MDNNGQIRGVVSYLTKLTHTVNEFRFRFVNVEVIKVTKNGLLSHNINYDLEIIPKQTDDIPYIWDFFSCKSKHIIEEGCDMVSLSFGNVYPIINDIYYDGVKIRKYGGNLPVSFTQKISDDIQQLGPKQIKSHFFCGGEKKQLILNITYTLSDVFIDDGITTDTSVYCSQILVDGKPLKNITQDIAETIVGYISEDDSVRSPLDEIVWDNITQYMDLEDCELWTHTYTYIRNIGDIEIDDYNYVNQSTFSSKMCDFISGDY